MVVPHSPTPLFDPCDRLQMDFPRHVKGRPSCLYHCSPLVAPQDIPRIHARGRELGEPEKENIDSFWPYAAYPENLIQCGAVLSFPLISSSSFTPMEIPSTIVARKSALWVAAMELCYQGVNIKAAKGQSLYRTASLIQSTKSEVCSCLPNTDVHFLCQHI